MSGLFERSPRLTRLRLPATLRAALVAQAQSSPEHEICGLLGGREDLATHCYAVGNVAAEPATNFFLEPRGQLAAMKQMRERGEALLAIYHSHPTGPAEPSARDRALAAYPGVAYLIVSLRDPARPVLGSFVFDGKEFEPLVLEVV